MDNTSRGKYIFRLDIEHNEADLLRIIEETRGQLVELVKNKGFAHIEVVELSQQLDEYIVQYHTITK
ncbi:Spo0E family sporulation regulatory protein-aspartic acid phosphatase [Brevibacillus sp. IT-7CA2]|uniref:Spo0E family sporulation regulatory protein-aspartic acid phosphatase n=1 Tax=Brevibacillus sp. IT-7CA2 TaxID=3026436 RepID=UPI0039DF41B4